MAYWGSKAGYINGTNDLSQPASSATPLYDLTRLDYTLDNDAPAAFGILDVASGDITDSLGNSGLTALTDDLAASVTFSDGQLGFGSDFSFTVGIPGRPARSEVFFGDQTFTDVMDVPEPDGFGLALLAVGRRRGAKSNWVSGPRGQS